MKYSSLLAVATATFFAMVAPLASFAQDIVLGQSAALTGPAQELGKEMQLGAKVYFDAINAAGGKAVGLSGSDANLITAVKATKTKKDPDSNIERVVDLGFVGEPDKVDPSVLNALARQAEDDFIPVVAPVGVGADGRSFNINADTAAGAPMAPRSVVQRSEVLDDSAIFRGRSGLFSYGADPAPDPIMPPAPGLPAHARFPSCAFSPRGLPIMSRRMLYRLSSAAAIALALAPVLPARALSFSFIADAGIDAQAEPAMHLGLTTGAPDLIAAAIAELGTEIGGMDTPISADPDTGLPWRTRFDAKVLALEEVMLQSAAYVVCAYLSGMRDSEIQAMKRGCLSISRAEDGAILRHRIKSTAYKGKRGGGEETEWVTIAPVAEAIAVLERLSARASLARGTTTLWPVLALRANTKTHVSAEIVRQLNRFRDHLNDRFGTAQAPIIPAGPNGAPWRLTTRQFRRTIAWHIANRPFGTIAGMIQYKHASVAAFEGYAGSSRSGFRGEIEAQRALGQIDDILVYFDERQGGARLGGPAANRIGAALDTVGHELAPLPAMIADRPRLRTMLGSLARTLHVGPLADCFFDPATALCLNRISEPGATGPMIAMCEPVRCPNACIAERHRPAWQRGADEARLLLREKRLPEPQRVTLQAEVARIETVLAQIVPGTATPHAGVAGEEEEAGFRVTD